MVSDASSREILTCCLALPLRSQQKTSDGLPDWTCIVYGFKTGFVSFLTERGFGVHRQQFDLQSVVAIKLRSVVAFAGGRDDVMDQQELVILYEGGVVVIINGMDLYASLQVRWFFWQFSAFFFSNFFISFFSPFFSPFFLFFFLFISILLFFLWQFQSSKIKFLFLPLVF